MKTLILPLFFSLFIVSCSEDNSKSETAYIDEPYKEEYLNVYGTWVGDFEAEEYNDSLSDGSSNKISLTIKNIKNKEVVTGESVVAGNKTPFKGLMISDKGDLRFTLKEPGDGEHDGVFEFYIDTDGEGQPTLVGYWTSYSKDAAVTKRRFVLKRKAFVYNKELMLPDYDYVDYEDVQKTNEIDSFSTEMMNENLGSDTENYQNVMYTKYASASAVVTRLNASNHLLHADEVKNLKKLELEIIRNTIFARHGYSFKKKRMRQFFDSVDWYLPISNDITNELTSIERENIALIKRFEDYATNSYDSFGR